MNRTVRGLSRQKTVRRVAICAFFVVALSVANSVNTNAASAQSSTRKATPTLSTPVKSTPSKPQSAREPATLPSFPLPLPDTETSSPTSPDDSAIITDDALISNASPSETKAIRAQLGSIAQLLSSRDANALQIFGFADFTRTLRAANTSFKPRNSSQKNSSDVQIVLSRLAVSPTGALLRITLQGRKTTPIVAPISVSRNALPQPFVNTVLLSQPKSYEVWLARHDESFLLSDKTWPIARDAADEMSDWAEQHWQNSRVENTTKNAKIATPISLNAPRALTIATPEVAPISQSGEGDILDLVAELRGGQWLPLRASAPWRGALLDQNALDVAAQKQANAVKIETQTTAKPNANAPLSSTRTVIAAHTSPRQTSSNGAPSKRQNEITRDDLSASKSVRAWLVSQMKRYEIGAAGTCHFLLQKGKNGWVGVDSIFEPSHPANDNDDDAQSRRLRLQMDGDNFLSAVAHRDFARILSRVGLHSQAADELQKTRLLQPDLVTEKDAQAFERNRVLDAQNIAQMQRETLKSVGLAPEHPALRVPFLLSQFRQLASPLTALRLGSEYSRLGYEKEAAQSLAYGESNAATFLGLPTTSNIDRAWFNVLRDQLKTRLAQAASKPPNVIRSDLFSVRCSLNDPNAPQLLAGLENAQLRIASSFGVPMGNTEVILWNSQSQFQAYTTRQAGRNTSEFVTALTITQLVNAENGPVVLGEEINFFADARADSISTIAHEYGHIAVRALARGRLVPDWFNEGIATYTEGGYDNYLKRVRAAKTAGSLLSMKDLQAWNVDGNRAFLAYSQANSMMDFIVARWGNEAILEILRQIGKDIPPDVALRQTLRVSPDAFYSLWRQNGIK